MKMTGHQAEHSITKKMRSRVQDVAEQYGIHSYRMYASPNTRYLSVTFGTNP